MFDLRLIILLAPSGKLRYSPDPPVTHDLHGSPMDNRIEKLLTNLCRSLVSHRTGFVRIQWLLLTNTYKPHPELTQLLSHLQHLPELMALAHQLPRHKYRFSETIEVLLACCDQYPLPRNVAAFTHVCQYPEGLDYPEFHGYICIFLIELRNRLLSSAYQYEVVDYEREAKNNAIECQRYVDRLFNQWSSLVVIRIDLSYRKDITVEFETLEADLTRLHTNRRHNELFAHLSGYITKIEYGIEKQLHVHALWFFNGHQRQGRSDSYIAQAIGEYWVDVITAGRGVYWNCNDNKHRYLHLGIGLVKARDSDKRLNLLRAIDYLCKKGTQVIKPHDYPKTKLLRKGQLTDNPNLGRPRL